MCIRLFPCAGLWLAQHNPELGWYRMCTLKSPSALGSQHTAANTLTGSGEGKEEGNALEIYPEQLISVCVSAVMGCFVICFSAIFNLVKFKR